MFARPSFVTLVFTLTSVWFFSCEDETENNRLALQGRWELIKGFRNQQQTETLSGTYFEFGADGKMQTNLPIGPEEPITYEVSQSEIKQKSTPPVKYLIQSVSDSFLVLALELRGMQFEMHLQRIEQDSSGILPPNPDTTNPGIPVEQVDSTSGL